MQAVTMERILALDGDEDVRDFLRVTRRLMLRHDDNSIQISVMARKLGMEIEILSSYIWLQIYIKELVDGCEIVPSISAVANQFCISLDEFNGYIEERANMLHEVSDDIMIFDRTLPDPIGCFPWETEMALLDDLQRDVIP
jgi:hypothetical protein